MMYFENNVYPQTRNIINYYSFQIKTAMIPTFLFLVKIEHTQDDMMSISTISYHEMNWVKFALPIPHGLIYGPR